MQRPGIPSDPLDMQVFALTSRPLPVGTPVTAGRSLLRGDAHPRRGNRAPHDAADGRLPGLLPEPWRWPRRGRLARMDTTMTTTAAISPVIKNVST